MRQLVSERRMSGAQEQIDRSAILEDTLNTSFAFVKRPRPVVEYANMTTDVALAPSSKEEVARGCMHEMFSIDASVHPQLMSSVEEYYTLVRGMDKHLSDVVCSFIPNVLNYTVIFATHLALMRVERDELSYDAEWKITGDDVEMATEILYDIYEQLVLWLESEVEVGAKAAEKVARKEEWLDAMKSLKTVEIENKGDGWVLKNDMFQRYANKMGLSMPSVYRRFKDVERMFRTQRVGSAVYIQIKEESE